MIPPLPRFNRPLCGFLCRSLCDYWLLLTRPFPIFPTSYTLGDAFEFLSVVDRGTSILVNTQTQPHFNAESALLAVATLFVAAGLPAKLRGCCSMRRAVFSVFCTAVLFSVRKKSRA